MKNKPFINYHGIPVLLIHFKAIDLTNFRIFTVYSDVYQLFEKQYE